MTRAGALGALLVLLGCVPAAEELAPRGAAGAALTPSAAARGEPFVTDDGWTVRFETLALVGIVGVRCEREFGGRSEVVLWNGARLAHRFVRALDVGACQVDVRFTRFVYDPRVVEEQNVRARIGATDDGLAAETVRRLLAPPDDEVSRPSTSRGFVSGPAMIVRFRGERDGRSVVADVALSVPPSTSSTAPPIPGVPPPLGQAGRVVVSANDVVYADIDVVPEQLFRDPATGAHAFGEIADADVDGDGFATPSELAAAPAAFPNSPGTPCTGSRDATHGACTSRLLVLRGRAGLVLVAR